MKIVESEIDFRVLHSNDLMNLACLANKLHSQIRQGVAVQYSKIDLGFHDFHYMYSRTWLYGTSLCGTPVYVGQFSLVRRNIIFALHRLWLCSWDLPLSVPLIQVRLYIHALLLHFKPQFYFSLERSDQRILLGPSRVGTRRNDESVL